MKKFLLLLFILCLPFTLQGDGGWSGNSLRELNDTDADTEPEDDFVLQYDSLYELWFPTDIETFLDDIYLNLDGESTNVTNGTFDITTSGTGSFANLFLNIISPRYAIIAALSTRSGRSGQKNLAPLSLHIILHIS